MRQLATDRVNRVHTPVFLQNVSLSFRNRELIADRVAPRITVGNQSDKYRVWGRRGLLVHESRWHPGTIPNAIEMRWSEDTFYAELRKLRTLILDTERRNSDSDVRLETRATELVTAAIELAREKRVADLFTASATYNASNRITKAGGSEWNATLNTEAPLNDILTIAEAVGLSAMVPVSSLSVVIPEPVYNGAIKRNTALLERVKYSETGIVTLSLLQQLLGVKEVLTAASMSVGAGPETADSDVVTGFTPTYLWGDTVWVGLINAGDNDNEPSFARSFNWKKETAGQERQVRQYRAEDEGREADWIECKEAVGEKVIFKDAGGIILNTLSTI